MTVNPYLGSDSLEPFLAACGEGAGLFVLTRTSNPGGADVQEAELAGGGLVWERIAELVAGWGEPHIGESGLSAVGAVVGATQPDAVARARELMPHAVLLLPGDRSAGRPGRRPARGHDAASRWWADRPVALGYLRLARARRRLAPGRSRRRIGAAPVGVRGMTAPAADLELARELALLGGGIALERYQRHPPATRKGDGSWVTEADIAAERAIRVRLAEARPDHNVLGEEHGLQSAAGGDAVPGRPTWIVDPIDGTHSYMIGIPLWATLVGLVVGGEPVVGVCHAPTLGETYAAAAGGGATMNGEPIAVRATPLDEAMIVSGGLRGMQEHGIEPFYRELAAAAWRVRGLGISGATCWSRAGRRR